VSVEPTSVNDCVVFVAPDAHLRCISPQSLLPNRRQLANPVDDKAVLMVFTQYLQRLGHSQFKTKQLSRDKVSIGSWKKPNEVDKQCPFAKRIHKSNTVWYQVHLADKVMVQRCWDSDCRQGRRYFQIRGGKVKDLGFTVRVMCWFSNLWRLVFDGCRSCVVHLCR